MDIDFHHGVVYVLARLAGFTAPEAGIIAYSSQYVDDATTDGIIRFKNGAMYKPVCSAHKALDYRNFNELAVHLVWVPFHFLPGNSLFPAGQGEDLDFITRIVCRPDSYVARDMVRECIRRGSEPNGLHRLGITLHVYADTWAHQDFAGIQHQANTVEYLADDEVSRSLLGRVTEYFKDIFDREASRFTDALPLGHGCVLSYPDRPYLKWKYQDYTGRLVMRDNTLICSEAAKKIYSMLKRFQTGDPDAEVAGLDDRDAAQLTGLLREISDPAGADRHRKWLEKIRAGVFRFGPEEVEYRPKGPGSWEDTATGGSGANPLVELDFSPDFTGSDWKKFHDALQDHHYFLLRVLFPRYGLWVA